MTKGRNSIAGSETLASIETLALAGVFRQKCLKTTAIKRIYSFGSPANETSACEASHTIATQPATFCFICAWSTSSSVLLPVWCE